jgi:hypothetical protein
MRATLYPTVLPTAPRAAHRVYRTRRPAPRLTGRTGRAGLVTGATAAALVLLAALSGCGTDRITPATVRPRRRHREAAHDGSHPRRPTLGEQ